MASDLTSFLAGNFPEYKVPPPPRLKALYSDIFQQKQSNPEGYKTSLGWWTNTLQRIVGSGHQPESGDKLVLHAGDSLAEGLRWNTAGRPLGLGTVIVRVLHVFMNRPLNNLTV